MSALAISSALQVGGNLLDRLIGSKHTKSQSKLVSARNDLGLDRVTLGKSQDDDKRPQQLTYARHNQGHGCGGGDEQKPISADLDGNGLIDGADLGLLLGNWGAKESKYDLNQDGNVNELDMNELLKQWTK